MPPKSIPQLPSSDFDVTSEFYSRIGFSERRRWDGEYLILLREQDDIELHFWFKDGIDPLANDASCYIRFDRADEATELHAEWERAGVQDLHAPTVTDYGLTEFALIDPHANLIRIGGSTS